MTPKNILMKISAHLHSASDRIDTPASQTYEHIRRAQRMLGRLLGDLPLKGEYPPKRAIEHLEKKPTPWLRNTWDLPAWRQISPARSARHSPRQEKSCRGDQR